MCVTFFKSGKKKLLQGQPKIFSPTLCHYYSFKNVGQSDDLITTIYLTARILIRNSIYSQEYLMIDDFCGHGISHEWYWAAMMLSPEIFGCNYIGSQFNKVQIAVTLFGSNNIRMHQYLL